MRAFGNQPFQVRKDQIKITTRCLMIIIGTGAFQVVVEGIHKGNDLRKSSPWDLSGRVDDDMNIVFLACASQSQTEIRLEERFAARQRHPTAGGLIKILICQDKLHDRFDAEFHTVELQRLRRADRDACTTLAAQ